MLPWVGGKAKEMWMQVIGGGGQLTVIGGRHDAWHFPKDVICEGLGGGVDGTEFIQSLSRADPAYVEQNGKPMASILSFSLPRKLVFHLLVTLPLIFSKTCGSLAHSEQ